VIVISILLQITYRPYTSPSDNWLEIFLLSEALLAYIASILQIMGDRFEGSTNVFVYLLHGLTLLLLLYIVLKEMYTCIRQRAAQEDIPSQEEEVSCFCCPGQVRGQAIINNKKGKKLEEGDIVIDYNANQE